DPGHLRPLAADLQHTRRRTDADDADPLRSDRHGDPPGPDTELDHRRLGAACHADEEGDVLGDAPAPRIVEARDRVVGTHAVMLPGVKTTAQFLFTGPRDGTGSPSVRTRG